MESSGKGNALQHLSVMGSFIRRSNSYLIAPKFWCWFHWSTGRRATYVWNRILRKDSCHYCYERVFYYLRAGMGDVGEGLDRSRSSHSHHQLLSVCSNTKSEDDVIAYKGSQDFDISSRVASLFGTHSE